VLGTTATGSAPEVRILNNESVSVYSDGAELFESVTFDYESETLEFTTISDISVILILDNEGNLEFQLPVMSKIVRLNKNLFSEGDYQIGFIMKGQRSIHYTDITIK